MHLLPITLGSPQQNVALDEALLDAAEAGDGPDEMLRIWEPLEPLVVLGRTSRVDVEINRAVCSDRQIPVIRRVSGGATILTGPGCLMYAVVLSYQHRPQLRLIDQAHRFVLDQITAALEPLTDGVARQGTSDLAIDGRKFSGNSLRCKRTHMLYHGTLLYNFPLEQIQQCLGTPPRQPDYRDGRSHDEFVTNLPLTRATIESALIDQWQPSEQSTDWPSDRVEQLVAQQYSRDAWNLEFPPRKLPEG